MINTDRTRKSPAILEDTDKGTSITWSVRGARLAKTAAIALLFSGLAACGVQNDSMGVENVAAFEAMSIPAYGSKTDCDAAANLNWKSANINAQELNFSCESVDTAALVKTDFASSITPNSLVSSLPIAFASAPAAITPAPVVAHNSGVNPMLWVMLGNTIMNNQSRTVSSVAMPASTGVVAPSAFINSTGHGTATMSATPQFISPTTEQYAGLRANGGIVKTGIIGSSLARAASYNAAKSSISSKSSVGHSSVGHSSGGHSSGSGGGGGGGGGG